MRLIPCSACVFSDYLNGFYGCTIHSCHLGCVPTLSSFLILVVPSTPRGFFCRARTLLTLLFILCALPLLFAFKTISAYVAHRSAGFGVHRFTRSHSQRVIVRHVEPWHHLGRA